MSRSKYVEFVVTRFVQTGDSEGDFISYSLTLEVRKNDEEKEIFQIPVSCSGTLQAVWGLSEEELKYSVYEIAREMLFVLLENKLPRAINSEIDVTSYNAPEIPPKRIHELPDAIRRSVTVFPEALTVTSNLPTAEAKQVSFLGHTIAHLRDEINSRTKTIWGLGVSPLKMYNLKVRNMRAKTDKKGVRHGTKKTHGRTDHWDFKGI